MTFITFLRSKVLVDWHQNVGSLVGEVRVISIFSPWDRLLSKDKWFENQTGKADLLLKQEAGTDVADALSHLHRAGSKDTSTLENEWVLIKSGDENKTLIFPFILHESFWNRLIISNKTRT